MDVATLPAEMIANIEKYLNHAQFVRLRKMSRLFDHIAKNYRLCDRIPVRSLSCTVIDGRATYNIEIFKDLLEAYNLTHLFKDKYVFPDSNPTNGVANLMEEILAKIKITQYFDCEDTIYAGSSFIEKLRCHSAAFRDCRELVLNLPVQWTRQNQSQFFNLFPKAIEMDLEVPKNADSFAIAEFLCSRKWTYFSFNDCEEKTLELLNDHVLEKFVKLGTCLRAPEVHTKFSFAGIYAALKAISTDQREREHSDWGSINIGNVKMEDAIEQLESIPGIAVKKCFEIEGGVPLEIKFRKLAGLNIDIHLEDRKND